MDKLKKIAIVVPEGDLILSSILGAYKLFLDAIKQSDGEAEVFILGGKRKKRKFFDGVFEVTMHGFFSEIGDIDLIVLPAIKSDLEEAIRDNCDLIQWLNDRYENGCKVASLCSGVFLLAEAGILNDVPCTCHWINAGYFQSRYPHLDFRYNEIITESHGVFTSGGAFSFYNLILYLIERFYGAALARTLAAIYQIDYSRQSQAPFVLFEANKDHRDESILKAQQYIEEHFAEQLLVADIAVHAELGSRTLSRRFKDKTGHTVNQYLQLVRMQVAKALLVETDKSIGEVQFASGYNDPKTFRRVFRKYTRSSPLEYRTQFQS